MASKSKKTTDAQKQKADKKSKAEAGITSSPKENSIKASWTKFKSRLSSINLDIIGAIGRRLNMSPKTIGITRKVVSGILLFAGIFLVLMPIVPQIPYYIKQIRGELRYGEYHLQDSGDSSGNSGGADDENIDQNRIVIESIGLDAPVVEGHTDEALNRGAWHRPNTSTPEKGGNTVITGHRFRYLPPNNLTFYHLDKVEDDDEIVVYWNGKEYDYVVTDIFVVDPDSIEIEVNTASPRLTLYTCTPLWTANKRLVVVAEPVTPQDAESEEGGQVELEEITD